MVHVNKFLKPCFLRMGSPQLRRKEAGELNKIRHENTLSNDVKAVGVLEPVHFGLQKLVVEFSEIL